MSALQPRMRGRNVAFHATGTGRTRRTLGRLVAALASGLVLVQVLPVAAATIPVTVTAGGAAITSSVDNAYVSGTYQGFNAAGDVTEPSGPDRRGRRRLAPWGRTSIGLSGDDRKSGGVGISNLTALEGGATIPLRALGTLGLGVGTGPGAEPFSSSWSNGSSTCRDRDSSRAEHNKTSGIERAPGLWLLVHRSHEPRPAAPLEVWVSAHQAGASSSRPSAAPSLRTRRSPAARTKVACTPSNRHRGDRRDHDGHLTPETDTRPIRRRRLGALEDPRQTP